MFCTMPLRKQGGLGMSSGFGKEEMNKYVTEYFASFNPSAGGKLLSTLSLRPHIKRLCYVPLLLLMVCYIVVNSPEPFPLLQWSDWSPPCIQSMLLDTLNTVVQPRISESTALPELCTVVAESCNVQLARSILSPCRPTVKIDWVYRENVGVAWCVSVYCNCSIEIS